MTTGKRPLTLRVHVPAALARQLGARRKQTGQSLSAIIVQALERLLGDEDKTVFQTSTVDALMEGASEGDMTMTELKTHGDFGLGTFDGLDGEMIELDGKVFQVRADGHAHPVEDSARTPFATVSFFKADESAHLVRRCEQTEMLAEVAKMLPSQNMFHALRIEGRFEYVKTRAVAKQERPRARCPRRTHLRVSRCRRNHRRLLHPRLSARRKRPRLPSPLHHRRSLSRRPHARLPHHRREDQNPPHPRNSN
jgi:hypothetical protein